MTVSDISQLHDHGELCNCSEAFIMSDRQMASRAAEINLYKSKSFRTMWSQQETGFHRHPVITFLNLSELTKKFEAKAEVSMSVNLRPRTGSTSLGKRCCSYLREQRNSDSQNKALMPEVNHNLQILHSITFV